MYMASCNIVSHARPIRYQLNYSTSQTLRATCHGNLQKCAHDWPVYIIILNSVVKDHGIGFLASWLRGLPYRKGNPLSQSHILN